jgi:signal transduction histidine kinase
VKTPTLFKQKKNISLNEKLIVYFVVLCILSIGLVSFFSYKNARKAIIDRTFDQLISIREVKKNRVENFFDDRIKDLNLLSTSSAIKQQLKNDNNEAIFAEDETVKNLFNYISSFNFYTRIYIGKTPGNYTVYPVSISKHSFSHLHSVKNDVFPAFDKLSKTRKNLLILDFAEKSNAEPSLLFSCPVKDDHNTILGYISLEVSGNALNEIMYENDPTYGFGKTGDFYIVGKNFLMRTQSRFIPNSVMSTPVNTISVNAAFQGNYGADIISDYRNIAVLSAYRKINIADLNWAIIAEIDLKEAMIPIYRIRNQILVIAFVIISIIFVIAFFISRMITSPIIRLNRASEQIAIGNFDLNLEVSTHDEIGALTTSFNNMAQQLKEQSDKLKVEQVNSMKALFDGQDMERQRLSRELHDGLGQELIAMKLKLEGIDDKTSDYRKSVQEVKQLVDETVENVRRISNDLMPAILDEFGLATAIRYLCESVPQKTGLDIRFNSSGNNQVQDKRIKMYLYRISQEAITNIIKHSGAKLAEISMSQQAESVSLHITDSGLGFDMKCIQTGNCKGLRNMRERVNILGGEIKINSEIARGTIIDINIPVHSG